ncbi:MYG1 protein, putative [Babesia bigemina]|uniref:MYG1 protein, putative n=1 Tax=Babesia bigemina TaxID=5866 RepID=A0A061DA49_BABBI|nr:MYG1 protein, putative [Babesia bigemina]CDR97408.1 MYG1 protein, putative [Babesia bigemina]|eukprot:XP_012769594.1 MYG1 protein, putative [Babesia bigemina]
MKIGTHSGNFHCDEALAISILKLLPECKDATVVRTRDPDVLSTCSVVVDVGGVYDPSKGRFDHHQGSFDEYFDENHRVTRLSSAGLVYKHFAKRVFKEVYGVTDEANLNDIYLHVYDNLIQSIDAVDTGVPIADGNLRYEVNTSLPSRVGRLNPSWVETHVDVNKRFEQAMQITLEEFDYFVRNFIDVHLTAKTVFLQVYQKRFETHPSGLVIETPRGMPFFGRLYHLEEKENIPTDQRVAFYVNYEAATGQWRCSCVSERGQQFTCRRPFPERLAGLTNAELENASGIKGLTFIHRGRFTCGGLTKEAVLSLITLTLQEKN